jgi:RNA polymerase sigma factor (TIGR02999 family)
VEITELLIAARDGDEGAFDALMPLVYAQLKALAHRVRGPVGADRLHTTELVHEAYLKLAPSSAIAWEGRAHFFAVAARAMRQVIVDDARRRLSGKRGSGERPVTFDGDLVGVQPTAEDVVNLDRVLGRLEALDARQARVVECRVFAGLTGAETAQALGVSVPTIERDWRMARAFLTRELRSA